MLLIECWKRRPGCQGAEIESRTEFPVRCYKVNWRRRRARPFAVRRRSRYSLPVPLRDLESVTDSLTEKFGENSRTSLTPSLQTLSHTGHTTRRAFGATTQNRPAAADLTPIPNILARYL
jgi:hypothetical protein